MELPDWRTRRRVRAFIVMLIAACVKWIDLSPEVSAFDQVVRTDERRGGMSDADGTAVELAARIAHACGASLRIVCCGPAGAHRALGALAAAVSCVDVVRVNGTPHESSIAVAHALSLQLADVDLVVCGDYSLDRGSGATPVALAHYLQAQQATSVVDLQHFAARDGGAGVTGRVVRRIDGGRREVCEVDGVAVLSVEGAALCDGDPATLRRASLKSMVSIPQVRVVDRPGSHAEPHWHNVMPASHVVDAPEGETALARIRELAGLTGGPQTSSQPVALEPEAAAALIMTTLQSWGYVDADHPAAT